MQAQRLLYTYVSLGARISLHNFGCPYTWYKPECPYACMQALAVLYLYAIPDAPMSICKPGYLYVGLGAPVSACKLGCPYTCMHAQMLLHTFACSDAHFMPTRMFLFLCASPSAPTPVCNPRSCIKGRVLLYLCANSDAPALVSNPGCAYIYKQNQMPGGGGILTFIT